MCSRGIRYPSTSYRITVSAKHAVTHRARLLIQIIAHCVSYRLTNSRKTPMPWGLTNFAGRPGSRRERIMAAGADKACTTSNVAPTCMAFLPGPQRWHRAVERHKSGNGLAHPFERRKLSGRARKSDGRGGRRLGYWTRKCSRCRASSPEVCPQDGMLK